MSHNKNINDAKTNYRVFETWAKFIQYILVAVPLLDSIAVFRIYASLLVTTGFVFLIKCLCYCALKYVRGNETSLGKTDNYCRVNESIQAENIFFFRYKAYDYPSDGSEDLARGGMKDAKLEK